MIWVGSKINKDYAWEISALHFLRQLSDGVTFFEFKVNWDRYLDDHTPRFDLMLVILNYKLIEFSIYYMWHRDELETTDESHIWKTNSTYLTPGSSTSPANSQTSETQ